MPEQYVELALGAIRVVLYAGYVLLAGTLVFWVLVWPDGRRDRRLLLLARAGTALLALATLGGPAVEITLGDRLWGDILTSTDAVGLSLRLASVAAAAFFLTDITAAPLTGRRALLPGAIVLGLAASMVIQSNAVGGDWEALKVVATAGHLLATASWLGGLTALAAVIIPREYLTELDTLIPRFSTVAFVSVVVLVATGTLHALAVAGGVAALTESTYGLVFGIKIVVFTGMLVLGNHGRRYASRVAARAATATTDAQVKAGSGVHSLAVVMGAELAIALAILGTTSLLVRVAPL